jgi:uncharacterized protein (DUF433 family)
MTTDRIEINPAVMMGKPVIGGTRITVELSLRKLAEGATEAELLEDYSLLRADDIRSAIPYGAESVPHEEVVLLDDTFDRDEIVTREVVADESCAGPIVRGAMRGWPRRACNRRERAASQ